jgi:methylated-DNA-protein-cysteine methyltransferase-like protein
MVPHSRLKRGGAIRRAFPGESVRLRRPNDEDGNAVNSHETYDLIYSVVISIPPGRVATYGQVADEAGLPRRARMVGYALRVLPDDSGVPWHRVVNASGEVSARGAPESEHEQRSLLEAEGVVFGRTGRIALDRYRWDPERDR